MAYGYLLEAEYESGYILTEDEKDHSPYDAGRNICHAIIEGRPSAAGHGRLVRFSLIPVHSGSRCDINWRNLWELDNPRPVYFRKMEHSYTPGEESKTAICNSHHFGYQYLNSDGENVQEIKEIA